MKTSRQTLSLPLYGQLKVAVRSLKARLGSRAPTVGIILGSGLGAFAERLQQAVAIDYADIPRFPISSVPGHAGRLVVGRLGLTSVAALQGRVHFYEGHDLQRVTFPLRTLIMLGCRTLIITNAAGGVNPDYKPGELVLIKDHINLFPEGPLRGEHDERLGPRFPDMTYAYAPELRELASSVGASLKMKLKEGVYAGLPGPSYETPAEIRMLRVMGADLCGMSTVPEVIVANHMKAKVLGISCVTNMAAGITGARLSHEEVTETADRVRQQFTSLVEKILLALGEREAKEARSSKKTPPPIRPVDDDEDDDD